MGPTRGLGVRYGSTVRKRYMKVVTEMRKPHRCPQCGFSRVKRESIGVWKCLKCGYTYTGGAYIPTTKLGIVAKRVAKGTAAADAIKTEETEAAKPD